ncbi:sclerostin domain-containing protein 1-like [Oryzias latipes]|uniref:Sclerostin domain containing 1b n=1 Tax=Oryzias latipes TaxID=8090 RepID=H2LVP2_ORYLA|nr:sclerostin domain-containing protein 1-like [Oryzias latipes]
MVRVATALQLLVLLVRLRGSASAFPNNATDSAHPLTVHDSREQTDAEDMNRPRSGGRRLVQTVPKGPDQHQVGCRELRSTKYISDGQCTSANPIKELVCAGECLPTHLLPNWIAGSSHNGRSWSRQDVQEWRCVTDRTRTQRVRLECQDGSSRTYKIAVVTSCKCKRYSRQQNESGRKEVAARSGKRP